MSKISGILNLITDFVTLSGIVFTGYLTKPGNNIWFVGRVKIEEYRKLSSEEGVTINLFGNVDWGKKFGPLFAADTAKFREHESEIHKDLGFEW